MNDGRNIAIYVFIGAIVIGILNGWAIGVIVLVVWMLMLRKH